MRPFNFGARESPRQQIPTPLQNAYPASQPLSTRWQNATRRKVNRTQSPFSQRPSPQGATQMRDALSDTHKSSCAQNAPLQNARQTLQPISTRQQSATRRKVNRMQSPFPANAKPARRSANRDARSSQFPFLRVYRRLKFVRQKGNIFR